MKKTVLAVAVGAALAAAGAAQAAVTVYGQAHVSIDSIDNGKDSSLFVSSNESRLGFKATEEFEGGLKGNVLYEQGVNIDNETNISIWDRDKYVNLQGGFGTVQLGYFNTPHKMVGRKVDLFGGAVGDSRNIISEDNDLRMDDGIMYASPSIGGVTVQALFKPEDGTEDSSVFNIAVEWKNEQHYVGVSLENQGSCYATTGSTCGDAENQSSMRIGYSGNFGPVKVNALVSTVTNRDGTDGKDRTAFGIGAGFKVGNGMIKGQYYTTPEYDKPSTDKSEATLIALGYDHSLSKTTTVYAAYAMVDNGDSATKSAAAAGHNNHAPTNDTYRKGTVGEQASALSVGLIHNF